MVIQTPSDFCWVQLLRAWHLLLGGLGLCWFLPFCGTEGLGSCVCITKTSLGTLCVGRRVSCRGSLQGRNTRRVPHSAVAVTPGLFSYFCEQTSNWGFRLQGHLNICALEKGFLIHLLFTNNIKPSPQCCRYLCISVFPGCTFDAFLALTHRSVDCLGSIPKAAMPAHGEGPHLATWH